MKEITKYICEICGNDYTTEIEANHCERKHCKVKKWKPIYPKKYKYPETIVATFEDGKEFTYMLIMR